jgi:hypothetical protein
LSIDLNGNVWACDGAQSAAGAFPFRINELGALIPFWIDSLRDTYKMKGASTYAEATALAHVLINYDLTHWFCILFTERDVFDVPRHA